MKKTFIFSLLFVTTFNALAADNCEQSSGILGKKCLTDEIGKADLQILIGEKESLKNFCNTCKSDLNIHLQKSPEGMEEKAALYGKATLDEFQKEMTFITMDLMRVRPSYGLKFDASAAINSCRFDNLKKPKCKLSKLQSQLYDEQVKKIQNATATELSNILSDDENKSDGLLIHKTDQNKCNISDKDVLYAQIRFDEDLITPELVASLKSLKVPQNVDVASFVKEKKISNELKQKLNLLKRHPLFSALLKDSKKLNQFLSEIKETDGNHAIIEKLYNSKYAKGFGDTIKDRCEKSFKNTSEILDTIYCKKSPSYIADNIASMEALSGAQFATMKEEKAEAQLQTLCAHLEMSSDKDVSFSTIRSSINSGNSDSITNLPLAEFKVDVGDFSFNKPKTNICEARNRIPPCTIESTDSSCKMLRHIDQIKSSTPHHDLANSSSENINLILRSLIGEGLPQKDGQVNTLGVTTLKNQGILPGGDTTTRPVQQDAGTFFKTVSNETNGTTPSPIPQSQTKTTQAPTPQFSPTSNATAAVKEPEIDDSSDSSKTTAPTTSAGTKQATNKFSNLSDSEQQDLLDRLKPKAKNKGAKTPGMNSASNQSDDSSFANGQTNSLNPNTRINQDDSLSNTAAQAPSVQNKFPASSGTQAKLDSKVVRKDASINDAKLSALQNRGPASDPVKDTTIALSKTESGLNKIEIKVPDESILDKKTPDLEAKIQDYLDKSASSLTGAKKGEAFIVKLGKYDIKVAINDYGVYVASCKDASLHPEYLAFLSRYFTGYKERVSTRLSMENIISKEQKKAN